jgi:2-pyrone-4,6-dicarboxylate lactonase
VSTAQVPNIPGPITPTRPPALNFPAGATDCHAHVFGPASRFKVLPNTHYIPPDCLLVDYTRMLRAIGCSRGVLVQPSVYGTDNTAMLEALQASRSVGEVELRGIAVVTADVSDRELERLHEAGVRGVRINAASGTKGLGLDDAPRLAARIKPLGWHLQFYADFREIAGLEDVLAALDIDIVIDHYGRIRTSEGVHAPAFQSVLRLLRRDNCWAKLMGPYFVSDAMPAYADLIPFARAMIDAAPDRVLWGTDWPHPGAREKMPNDADLVDLLADWVPDNAQRHRMLVDNPARRYGFAGQSS